MNNSFSFKIDYISCRRIEIEICKHCSYGFPTHSNISDRDFECLDYNCGSYIDFTISTNDGDITGEMHIIRNADNSYSVNVYNYKLGK